MQKLSFQDAAFLRAETTERPAHVGALMVFTRPRGAPASYMRKLAAALPAELIASNPLFLRKLKDPRDLRNPAWVEETRFDQDYHFRHYALPQPGKMEDLLRMVSLAHQPVMERSRPLWEFHLIEGLPKRQFALYAKLHHSLIDGAAGIGIMRQQLQARPRPIPKPVDISAAQTAPETRQAIPRQSRIKQWENNLDTLREQSRAVPQVVSHLLQSGLNREQDSGTQPLPFTAPASILNQEGGARRHLIALNLPLQSLRDIAHSSGGTVNDALIAVFGGALRSFLMQQNGLPRASLVATLPVAVQSESGAQGNSLSIINCPLGTNISDPARRLQRIVKVTRKAKKDLGRMSNAGLQDVMNLFMLPVMALTLTHLSSKLRPATNTIVSNVPGPKQTLYLADAPLQAVYPISLLTDAAALNFTAISYRKQMCIGLIACPDGLSEIEQLEALLREAHAELAALV